MNKPLKLLFLVVLSQLLIDGIDDNASVFKMSLKNSAKKFQSDLLLVMDRDLKNPVAVDQLIRLGAVLQHYFELNQKANLLEKEKQEALNDDLNSVFDRYLGV